MNKATMATDHVTRTTITCRKRYENNDTTIECSCKAAQSCSVGVMADCVALCCCPCAIVSILTLTFIKLPWVLGKKSVRSLKAKIRRKQHRRRVEDGGGSSSSSGCSSSSKVMYKNAIATGVGGGSNNGVHHQLLVAPTALRRMVSEDLEEEEGYCACFEAERVWNELYQMGHLGFGRLSFQEIKY